MTRTVLITGVNGDIGRAAVANALHRGFRVFAAVRNEAHYDTFEMHDRLHLLTMHVDQADSVADAFAQIDTALDSAPLNAVVHCAAIERPSTIEFMDPEILETTLKVNTIGSLAVMQQAFPRMRKSKGNLVLASSIWGIETIPLVGGYSASKHALESLVTAARRETLGMGFSISIANIGAVKSRMLDGHIETVNKMLSSAADQEREHYRGLYEAHIENTKKFDRLAIRADHVAEKLIDIASHPKPAHRYLIGKDARLVTTLQRLLPQRIMDRIVGNPA